MLELYPHNQKAYQNVLAVWETTQRTCVVHATGTGKSLIIAKNILDNPNSKHLFLAPSVFIFNELKKYLTKNIKNVSFVTYQYLSFSDISFLKNFDFIYLDEFHRAGAEEWGKYVDVILLQNLKAKVLGTSATHIRYLDNNRNMAEELFDNSIASFLDLGTAIEKKIHKKPKYVAALYNVREILNDSAAKLKSLKKHKELEKLNSNRVLWEKSTGVEFILKKHLTLERKKILVFCKSYEHLLFVKALLIPVLKTIYNNEISFNDIYSVLGEKVAKDVFLKFENSNAPEVLFSIDMLNEGVHIKNVDTVMMFRDTSSPIIYFQQMGRCFSSGQKHKPLIFDFVNNFNIKNDVHNIKNNFYHNFNEINDSNFYKKRELIVDFYDEIVDFKDFLNSFSLRNFKTWEESFEEFKEFVSKEGRLPNSKESFWYKDQKKLYNKGFLEPYKINLLLSVREDVFISSKKSWEESFEEFKVFYKKNKRIPTREETFWVLSEKRKYTLGNLSNRKKILIEKVCKDFFNTKKSWEESFEEFKEFVSKEGRLPNRKESKWYYDQLSKIKRNVLSNDKRNLFLNYLEISKTQH